MYDKVKILETAKTAIKDNECTTIEEVCSYLPCDQSTLFSKDEWKIEVLEPIKRELDLMKTSLKAKMKQTWRKSDSNPTLQIAAFKLMATDDELNILNTNKVLNEHTGKDGNPIQSENTLKVEVHDFSNGAQTK